MKNYRKMIIPVIATFALLANPAYAQMTSDLSLAVEVESDVDVSVTTTLEGVTDVDLQVESEVDGSIKPNNKEGSGSLIYSPTDEDSASVQLHKNNGGVTITASSQVSSEEDLEIFVNNSEILNSNVVRVHVESEDSEGSEVRVVYRHQGKLFGFIPVTLKSTTTVKAQVNAEAQVRSSLPWWSFLVSGKQYDRASIESSIKNNANIKANASIDASAEAKARVTEAIIAELNAGATLGASTDTN